MAAAKRRNAKTHPKPQGDGGPDRFVPPDRADQPEPTSVEMGPELISIREDDGAGVDAGEEEAANDAEEGRETRVARTSQVIRAGRERDEEPPARTEDDDEEGERPARGQRYSRAVRQRIRRETTARNRAETLARETQAKLTEERTARQKLEERLGKLERANTEVAASADIKALETKVKDIQTRLEAAGEEGNTAKIMQLGIELGDAKAELRQAKHDAAARAAASTASTTDGTRGGATGGERTDGQRPATDPYVADQTALFREANPWWGQRKHVEVKDDAIAYDNQILSGIKRGKYDFEPYSDEHFEELARKLHEAHPDLEICDLDGEPYDFEAEGDDEDEEGEEPVNGRQRPTNGARGGGRAPMNGANRNGRRAETVVERAKRGQYLMTDADRQHMRLYGMDPTSAKDVKAHVKERIRSILTEAGREG